MDFRRPVRCVALDPEYAKTSSRRVVSGGMAGQLIMSEKGIKSLQYFLQQDGLGTRKPRYILVKGQFMPYPGEVRILHGLTILYIQFV